ncbi:hypothetical protein ACFSTD_23665 [Novosphingobium colocasiae]
MTDDLASFLVLEATGDLFGRPACGKAVQHGITQVLVAFEPASTPAPG